MSQAKPTGPLSWWLLRRMTVSTRRQNLTKEPALLMPDATTGHSTMPPITIPRTTA